MSDIVFMIRGHKHWQDRFINELSSRYPKVKRYNKATGQMEDKIMELRVCPIQLFEVNFPDDQYDIVANSIFRGSDGKPAIPKMNKFIWALRKMMGLKPLPEYKKEMTFAMSPPEHQEIIAIGFKEDYWVEPDGRHVAKKDKSPLAEEGI